MNFSQKMAKLKSEIDREIENQFNIVIAESKRKDNLICEALEHAKKISLAGGKRIRGSLLTQSYFGFGGKEKKKILRASVAIEIVHMFLLIHDDIIDHGELRHGQETLHKLFAKKYLKKITFGNVNHFGESIALISGEMLHVIANKILLESGFSQGQLLKANLQLQKIIATTIIGQSQDIAIEHSKKITEKEVLSMYENKTARYTFEGPLYIGAILAGFDDKKTLQKLSNFALPLGIAFQIQDDILGVFGDEEKIGKSVASDIEEGKQSILVVRARKLASLTQRKKLEEILGKKNISQKEITIFQDILKSTGSLDYSKKMASEYIKKAKFELEKIIIKRESKDFLIGLIEYLDGREI